MGRCRIDKKVLIYFLVKLKENNYNGRDTTDYCESCWDAGYPGGCGVITTKISARNQMPGTVKKITKGPVSTEVVIAIAGGNEVVSSITTHSAMALNLHEGSRVYAVIKASEVMVAVD